jgi:hypothetical protein
MDFIIKDIKDNALNVSRRIGYLMLGAEGVGVYNIVRKLSGNHYPRFHVYLKQQGDHFHFSLHLDQKQPIYQGTHAHNGEYDGPVVETEADRIKNILSTNNYE